MVHTILVYAGLELQQFTAFSVWLRNEIDIQAADPTSSSAEEAAEKDTMVDHAKVLDYVQGAMTKSRLIEFFQQPANVDNRPQLDLAAEGTSLYDLYKKELKRYKEGTQMDKRLPRLQDLFAHLSNQCEIIFNNISLTQKRNVMCGKPVLIERDCNPSIMDAKMRFEVWHYHL